MSLFFEDDDSESEDFESSENYVVDRSRIQESEITIATLIQLNRKDQALLKKLVNLTLKLLLIFRTKDFTDALQILNKLKALKPRTNLLEEEAFVFGYMVPLLHVLRVIESLALKKKELRKLSRKQGQAFWKLRKKIMDVPFWDEIYQLSVTRTRTGNAIRESLKHDLCVELVLQYHDPVSFGCSNLQFMYKSLEMEKFINNEIFVIQSKPPNLGQGRIPEPHLIGKFLSKEEFERRGFM